MSSTLKIIRWIAFGLITVLLLQIGFFAWHWYRGETSGSRFAQPIITTTGVPDVGGPFSLVNHRGERVTQDTFKGKPTVYFFGFTHCPEVCPTTLFEMTQHLKDLGPDADRLNVVFVTVDPERDTPELLKTYMESFDPRIVALTGTPEEVTAATKAFRVAYRKVPTEGGNYTMEHSASVIVTDAQGGFVSLIDYHEDKATALAKLKRAIRG
ncbi:SCO family protein [Microvirga sp. CF3062]|uniref:SCO family protein n=1 Tax=Microvirga sp. CF3062 TaxID=3110182 RepID=UPI002E75BD11|nr:SCO family protein [Microvirga sp. CF3062]MEE1657881.1 SCO family protein [Microvirga sp. CF3062]